MIAFEQHYTPKQLAELWGFSVDTIRTLFESESCVLIIKRPERMHKRVYTTMKIPASVAARVHAKYTERHSGRMRQRFSGGPAESTKPGGNE